MPKDKELVKARVYTQSMISGRKLPTLSLLKNLMLALFSWDCTPTLIS